MMIDCDAGLRCLDGMTGVREEMVFDAADVVHGRCAPIDAIYTCKDADTLFLLPAPARRDDGVYPEIMGKLVPFLKEYYDYVLLDSPAGVGVGFQAAACAADRALVVCSPDPVCIRGTDTVRELLSQMHIENQSLVINRFSEESFHTTQAYQDLDAVIDGAGIQLLAVVREDFSMIKAFFNGESASEKCKGMMMMSRLASRFEGESVPFSL